MTIVLAMALLQIGAVEAQSSVPTISLQDGRLCNLLIEDAAKVAGHRPKRNAQVAILDQRVNCETRSVSRTIGFGNTDIMTQTFPYAQETADRLACSTSLNRESAANGWTFSVELVGPQRQTLTATAHGKCEGTQ